MKKIFWIAGESSGDLHSSIVLRELKRRAENFKNYGIGGYKMQAEGFEALFAFQRFAVMGFWEVIKHLPFFWNVERTIRKILKNDKPDLVVLVDYPGMNMRIAKIAYEMGIKVLYYICPQFWAWKHGRVNQLAENTNHVACILPFEKDLLDIHRINSTYVGHPIAEEIEINISKDKFADFFGLDPNKKWITFLPGSRNIEMQKNLPIFLNTIRLMQSDDFQFIISRANTVSKNLFDDMISKSKLKNVFIVDGYNYEMMKYSEVLAVTSGTATLETALVGTPFVIVYSTSPISYYIAKNIIKIRRIGLPNIILEEDVIPELIQKDFSPEILKENLIQIIDSPEKYRMIEDKLSEIGNLLGDKIASQETADIIVRILSE
ncbi:MAG: lipid-A-disaccharide synthase [Candidatus Cloacimonetes bacterium]|nr:lipid-A-disaccharide synthase [Candidatus Cloacimonadota bacterium]